MDYKISLKQILEVTANITGITINEIIGKNRLYDFCEARCMYSRAARFYGYTVMSIGQAINRNHSAIISCLKNHEDKYEEKYYRRCFEEIIKALNDIENDVIIKEQKDIIQTKYGERIANITIRYSKNKREI